MTNFLFYHL